ncbi:hypothetical protein B566_EDAN007073 [Ephemera danica]|nr:hypothetical protein B566_EDAN007073 [Ephemera danica]
MDSCFPPLATLSLKENSRNSSSADPTMTPDVNELANYTKIEILQDLDLYYIRQIAHKLKELDLEQKIELEIKMREGSAKLLAASRQQAQSLEAARALLTSNERMSAYMAESGGSSSRARVSLSELRMPLMWRGTDHFKNKGDYRRFAVFCLARIGTEIFDTTLVCPVDRSLTDVTFPDVMLFQNVPADFRFTLEVYSHLLAEDLSMASTPRKLQRTLHSSISRTVGKKLAASLRDELHGRLGPQFQLVASAQLSLAEVHDGVRTHDLQVHTLENRSQELPLFGHFCCRLAAQPDCVQRESVAGEVSLREGRGQPWSSVYATLQAELNLQETRVVGGDASNRYVHVTRLSEGQEVKWTLQLASVEEQQRWLRHLSAAVADHQRWERAAESVMNIPSPGTTRHAGFPLHTSRQGSLYEQTPLIENVAAEDAVSHHRPTVHEIFGLTPSTSLSSCASSSASSSPPATFRERSNSSSGLRATLRGHWPFKHDN